MKVIFLDIDGVLNNLSLIQSNGFDYIDEGMVSILGLVVAETGAEIVLSSTWRVDPRDRALVEAALKRNGMSVMDSTPNLGGRRSDEISKWLAGAPHVESFAILDDIDDAGFGMGSSFFQTDPEVGLTVDIARKVSSHFNGVGK
jgi:hypothetical protein